ncbi:MAG: sigma-70 family RNA polymerase sigma factor [Bacteroidetes bacterium]|nr:sigma-70 family RNA polymerase sigma factor [Bacteroidota bacterium]
MLTSIPMAGPHHLTVEQVEDEQRLVLAAQKDPRQFEPLYTRYYERIAQYLYHRVENKDLAFELTAHVFYKALENLSRYKPMGVPFSAWLFRIAGNELNQWYRKNKTRRTISIDEEGINYLKQDLDDTVRQERESLLIEALQQLDEADVELVHMRFFEKRNFREICDILEIGESACKMRLYRILEKLKLVMKAMAEK